MKYVLIHVHKDRAFGELVRLGTTTLSVFAAKQLCIWILRVEQPLH